MSSAATAQHVDNLELSVERLHTQILCVTQYRTVSFKGARSLLFCCDISRTAKVTMFDRPRQLPHVNSYNSLARPSAAQGTSKTDCRKQMGGGETQPAKDYRSPTAVARAPSGPRFSLNQGHVHAGVTVAAAPSGFFRPHPVWMKVFNLVED